MRTAGHQKDSFDVADDAVGGRNFQLCVKIDRVADGVWTLEQSPLRHAPHTTEELIGDWERPYSRELGAFPLPALRVSKYFPPVSRIDGVYGDRHLVCSCEPLEAYAARR